MGTGADSFIGHDTQQLIDSDVFVGFGRDEGAPKNGEGRLCQVGVGTSLQRMCRRNIVNRQHAFFVRRFDVLSPAKLRKTKRMMKVAISMIDPVGVVRGIVDPIWFGVQAPPRLPQSSALPPPPQCQSPSPRYPLQVGSPSMQVYAP